MRTAKPLEMPSRFSVPRRRPVIRKPFAGLALATILVSPAFAAKDRAQAFMDATAIHKANAIVENGAAMVFASCAMTALL
jgi:hypothetical protein